ncbi:uncharacterized protein F5891DRAFT_1239269 [Suillus fuscotomentosus]|uniref:F-box domain-containing protein n=1 Tax=Suillus fuscotomentosus TaxID=1912939 RepID=A0AAD4E4X2_9AGAM|nr:uncharacterized protein F5891DRAFT_1239269 [Suillus fuscotomentosus]KAG1898368.1 hypothetical protein F5891DRAFT_1239269 [Suillus fuscotomentosus]
MAIELFLFPTELIWRILSILAPRDICRCAITCRAFWNMIQNSVHIQYQLELYAQGFIKTATMDSIDVSREMSSLKRSTSLWRSGLHLNTVLEERLMNSTFPEHPSLPWLRFGMKCGLLWMLVQSGLFIRDYNTNTNLSRTWAIHDLSSQRRPNFLIVDPLQDLVVIVSLSGIITVADTEQDYHAFWVECRSASSQHPHPDSACASLECKHTFDIRGVYHVDLIGEPAIYENESYERASATFMQAIDWRKGYVKSHLFPDYYQQGSQHQFYVVDQRTIVVIGSSFITVHTLQDIDGSPRPRLTYLLPKCHHSSFPFMIVHASPSFSGTAPRADLMPGYVPSLESQIIVLELISRPRTLSIILVIDTVIFSGAALQSETHVKIPWSDWGPQHTCCFPHDPSYQISVFGSKMAYTLPRDHSPEPGQRLEKLSAAGHFYIHIWDFNKRAITRSGNFYNPDSPDLLVRKPGGVVQSCFDEEIISNHPYTATVCRAPFLTYGLRELFLEQDRLILTSVQPGTVDIQVVSPVQMDVGSDFTH